MPAKVPIDQTCVGYWKLNDASGQTTIKDYTANGNDGTSANNKVDADDPWGVSGGAMDFSLGTDEVAVTSIPSLTDQLTVSVWMKTNTVSGEGCLAHGTTTGSWTTSWWLERYSTGIIGAINGQYPVASGYITTGVWYHYVMTYDGANILTYINGVNVGTKARTGNIANQSGVNIGQGGAHQYKFNGDIAEVRVYNRVLSASEIMKIYRNGNNIKRKK